MRYYFGAPGTMGCLALGVGQPAGKGPSELPASTPEVLGAGLRGTCEAAVHMSAVAR